METKILDTFFHCVFHIATLNKGKIKIQFQIREERDDIFVNATSRDVSREYILIYFSLFFQRNKIRYFIQCPSLSFTYCKTRWVYNKCTVFKYHIISSETI